MAAEQRAGTARSGTRRPVDDAARTAWWRGNGRPRWSRCRCPSRARVRSSCRSRATACATPTSRCARCPRPSARRSAGRCRSPSATRWAGRVAALGDGVSDLTDGEAVALVSPTSCGAVLVVHPWPRRHLPARAGRPWVRRRRRAGRLRARTRPPRGRTLGTLDPVHAAPLTDAGATSHHAVSARRRTARRRRHRGRDRRRWARLARGAAPARSPRADVIAVDTNPARLAYVRELGAHAHRQRRRR